MTMLVTLHEPLNTDRLTVVFLPEGEATVTLSGGLRPEDDSLDAPLWTPPRSKPHLSTSVPVVLPWACALWNRLSERHIGSPSKDVLPGKIIVAFGALLDLNDASTHWLSFHGYVCYTHLATGRYPFVVTGLADQRECGIIRDVIAELFGESSPEFPRP
jgi:hypothetical protein